VCKEHILPVLNLRFSRGTPSQFIQIEMTNTQQNTLTKEALVKIAVTRLVRAGIDMVKSGEKIDGWALIKTAEAIWHGASLPQALDAYWVKEAHAPAIELIDKIVSQPSAVAQQKYAQQKAAEAKQDIKKK